MHDGLPDYGGTLTYSYTVNDNGERIKNGPISITGKIASFSGFSFSSFL